MSSKHTPGPWEVRQGHPLLIMGPSPGGKYPGAPVVCSMGLPTDPRHQADARLIAAAPELLAALERIVEVRPCMQWGPCGDRRPDGINTKPHPIEEQCPACQARAAIARARGDK